MLGPAEVRGVFFEMRRGVRFWGMWRFGEERRAGV
jgi:hypothetical protein